MVLDLVVYLDLAYLGSAVYLIYSITLIYLNHIVSCSFNLYDNDS